MSEASSPLTPRLITVRAWPGKCRCSSTSSLLGEDAAGELAPAPAVEEEPIATILIGSPAASRNPTRGSGRSIHAWSWTGLHFGSIGRAVSVVGAGAAGC